MGADFKGSFRFTADFPFRIKKPRLSANLDALLQSANMRIFKIRGARPKHEMSLPTDFDTWWNAPGNWVEEPNKRRSGWSGMMRAPIDGVTYYVKKQNNHLYRSLKHPFGRPTTAREYENILRLQKLGLTVPKPIFHGMRKTAAGFEGLLVTEELSGFVSLDQQRNLDTAQISALAEAVGKAIGIMHRAGFQHSCLYDKHIMVLWTNENPEIALIDLEKLRPTRRATAHDLDQLKRHQHLWNDDSWALLLASHARQI